MFAGESLVQHPAFRLCGAYSVRHVATDTYYVGTTNDLYGCYVSMLANLQRRLHSNMAFQQAYNQDGRLDFSFVITDTRPEAQLIEHEMLVKYQSEGKLFHSLVE